MYKLCSCYEPEFWCRGISSSLRKTVRVSPPHFKLAGSTTAFENSQLAEGCYTVPKHRIEPRIEESLIPKSCALSTRPRRRLPHEDKQNDVSHMRIRSLIRKLAFLPVLPPGRHIQGGKMLFSLEVKIEGFKGRLRDVFWAQLTPKLLSRIYF